MEADPLRRVAIFLHSGDYDRLHQGCSIAAAAAAGGREVQLFLFWWALDRFLRGGFAEPALEGLGPREVVEAAEDAFDEGAPTAAALLEAARASGKCTLYACSASAIFLGQRPDRIASSVDQVVGWSAILGITSGIVDRFYL